MPDLVSLPEIRSFLADPPSADDTVLSAILEYVEGLFESETGRSSTPFAAAGSNRTEVKDATGGPEIFLDYPVAVLTSVNLGYDPANPAETLDVADKNVVTYAVGSRRLSRTDGGVFGVAGKPRYVQVVYNHQADLPEPAKLAIKRVCALIYRQRGSEDAAEETIGGYSRRMAKFGREFVDDDPTWRLGVASCRRLVLA